MPAVLERVPLDRSTRQIRLLSFLSPDAAGTASTRIRCRLVTYDLDTRPSFVALSYAWGDAHPLREICLNGEVFPVRPNLYSALSALRQGTGLHWIDAICIDQQNDSERGHQVNMMGTIYSQACYVIVWLGPGCADSNKAMAKLAAYCTQDPLIFQANSRNLIEKSCIADNAYWGRAWVIQEFNLAGYIFLMQGRSALSWNKLKRVREEFQIENAMRRLVDCKVRREQGYALTTSETTLDSLISMFQSSECGDARDKVYALLSLVQTQPVDSIPLYPDYTITPRQLYYRVLGNARHSPTLRDTVDWNTFRDRLRSVLNIPHDEDYERNNFLYLALEHERPLQKPLLSLHPDYRTKFGYTLLKALACHLHWPLAAMETDPQCTYERVVESFQSFPKEEDPETWKCFDTLLGEALGLRSTTDEDSAIWNMFIDFPE